MPSIEPSPPQPQAERRSLPRGPDGSSFVPGLVHELRNFAFGISGNLDAFDARFGQRPELARYATVMRGSVDRLNGFLEELADYGDPRELDWTDREPGLLFREAVELRRPRAEAEGASIVLELADPLPVIRVDEQNLVKALVRLLDLALGSPGGRPRVTLAAAAGRRQGQAAVLGQVDGARLELPDLDLSRLFEPFYFRTAGFSRLALPVARRVFERHGGSLRAERDPRGGTRFCFVLPALAEVP